MCTIHQFPVARREPGFEIRAVMENDGLLWAEPGTPDPAKIETICPKTYCVVPINKPDDGRPLPVIAWAGAAVIFMLGFYAGVLAAVARVSGVL